MQLDLDDDLVTRAREAAREERAAILEEQEAFQWRQDAARKAREAHADLEAHIKAKVEELYA